MMRGTAEPESLASIINTSRAEAAPENLSSVFSIRCRAGFALTQNDVRFVEATGEPTLCAWGLGGKCG